jgi:hypothetical protein
MFGGARRQFQVRQQFQAHPSMCAAGQTHALAKDVHNVDSKKNPPAPNRVINLLDVSV